MRVARSLGDTLLECPVSIAAGVLSGWIDIKCLCRLDTAFCNRESRPAFLKILCSGQLMYDLSPLPSRKLYLSGPLLSWACSKKITLRTLQLLRMTDTTKLSLYLPVVARMLKRLYLYNFRGDMAPVIDAMSASELPRVRILSCSCCDVELSFRSLVKAVQSTLRDIRFSKCCQLTAEHATGLLLPNARILSIDACILSDQVAIAFSQACPNIVALNLSNSCLVSDAAVLSIAHTCTRLQLISLCEQNTITDAAVVELSRCCTALCIVDIGCCTALTDTSVIALASNCAQLTSLYINKNANISDVALMEIAMHRLATFTALDVTNCPRITNKGVMRVLKSCQLRTLFMGYASGNVSSIAITQLEVLLVHCNSIEQLYLQLQGVNSTIFYLVARNCKSIQQLVVADCEKDNLSEGIKYMVRQCRDLKLLVVPEDMVSVVQQSVCAPCVVCSDVTRIMDGVTNLIDSFAD